MISIALIESILTGFLVLSVLATTAKGFAVGSEALVVGMTLLVIHLIGIPASNGSFNIARSLGPAIVSMHFGALSQLIHLAGFQFAGVIMALAIHKVIHEPR
jgi:aquaporin Z